MSIVCCVSFVFFVKQKTAYEMRISDWSSDVCSSDLRRAGHVDVGDPLPQLLGDRPQVGAGGGAGDGHAARAVDPGDLLRSVALGDVRDVEIGRASCRKECVSTCRSRWSPYH